MSIVDNLLVGQGKRPKTSLEPKYGVEAAESRRCGNF